MASMAVVAASWAALASAAGPVCEPMGVGNQQDCQRDFNGAFACTGGWAANADVGQGRAGYCYWPPNASVRGVLAAAALPTPPPGALRGSLDSITLLTDGSLVVVGWAVDPASQGGGRGHVKVAVEVDGKVEFTTTANVSRPGLVTHHVAPDPNHGVDCTVPGDAVRRSGLLTGNHTVTLRGWPVSAPPSQPPVEVGVPHCVTDGRVDTACGGPPEPESWFCCKSRMSGRPDTPTPPVPRGQYPHPPATRPAKGKASVVLIITDDQDVWLGSLHVMNTTLGLMQSGGATFENFFVTTPICCPSRISLLSGRWAHNTGAVATTPAGWCALGKYWQAPMQSKSLPNYLHAAGVHTGLFGKEINVNTDNYISPGWERFFALGGSSEGHYYNDWFCDQGRRYNSTSQYMTDVIREKALEWLKTVVATDEQFFAYIAPHAPHTRATPPPSAQGYFLDEVAPRTPSWNVSMPDHHRMVREQPPMTDLCAGYSDQLYRNRLQALLGVDDLVKAVADELLASNRLDSTYFIYTSDHGFHLGEMRMPFFKGQPYDTDIRVPFMIRGPGITPGSTVAQIGLNVDIAPTVADLLGTEPFADSLVDGHSLLPLVLASEREGEGEGPDDVEWREDFLFEFWAGGKNGTAPARGLYCNHVMMQWDNTYQGVRTASGLKLVDFLPYEDIQEAYNLTADPWEMHNLANDPASQPWVNKLRARLKQLSNCSQDGCWRPQP